MVEKMAKNEVATQLSMFNTTCSEPWCIQDEKLHKSFKFNNFISAFGFMSQVAILPKKPITTPNGLMYTTVLILI